MQRYSALSAVTQISAGGEMKLGLVSASVSECGTVFAFLS